MECGGTGKNAMTKRFVGVLIFAFVVASVASLLLYRLLASSRPASAKTAAATIRLAVAARDLEAGVVLKEEDVRMAEWTGVRAGRARMRARRIWSAAA